MSAGDRQPPSRGPRVGYVVSRFPSLTETFVLRELEAVEADGRVELRLMSLFPPLDAQTQPAAERWLAGRYRPGAGATLVALLGWGIRRPFRSARTLARVVVDHYRDPRVLAKALVTTALGFAQARHVRRSGIEHVHAHFAAMPAQAAWTIHRLTGVSYSVTPHAHDIFIHQLGLRTRLAPAAFVVAISGFHQRFLASHGTTAERTPRIGMGLDLTRYAFAPAVRDRDRPLRLLMVSSFRPYKGHRYLIDALASDPRLRDVRLELVGDGPLRATVAAQVTRLGLDDRVTFAGPQPESVVHERLRHADALVQPSIVQADGDTEGLPTTLVEAAACGVTLVATRVAGVPDLVRDDETGVLADPEDVPGLANAIARVLTADDPQLAAWRTAARSHVEQHHDATRTAERLSDWFLGAGSNPYPLPHGPSAAPSDLAGVSEP